MNSFIGPFLVGFATCGGLVLTLGAGIWIGAKIVHQKKDTPQG